MRYYIPTTILNIGNILSSDSISPESFYYRRGFGNPHWYNVEENCIPNVLLLYKYPFKFIRPDSELEDRPVLIAIDSSEEFVSVSDEVVACDHTIYFDWNTEFIFFCQEDKISALSLSNIGITTKMTILYKEKRMKVEDSLPMKKFHWDICQIEFAINEKALSIEYKKNKLQGLLYGYYVGAFLTTTPYNVGCLCSLKNAYDALISDLSSFLGKTQKKEALECVKIAKECLANEIGKVESIITNSHHALSITSNEIEIEKERAARISNKYVNQVREQKLLLDWINTVLLKDNWGKHINSIKSTLADELTDEAIKVWEDDWETSEIRAFLNDLRHHLAGEAFHQEWDNGLLSSLAAFLVNGDDWEEMLLFMQKKGIYDYRLAFALWGTFVGFADMPRTFTDYLFDQERKYIGDYYDFIYKQIHGRHIQRIITEQPKPKKSMQETIWEIWNNMPPKFKKEKNLEEGLTKSLPAIDLNSFLNKLSKQTNWGKRTNRWKFFNEKLKQPDMFSNG